MKKLLIASNLFVSCIAPPTRIDANYHSSAIAMLTDFIGLAKKHSAIPVLMGDVFLNIDARLAVAIVLTLQQSDEVPVLFCEKSSDFIDELSNQKLIHYVDEKNHHDGDWVFINKGIYHNEFLDGESFNARVKPRVVSFNCNVSADLQLMHSPVDVPALRDVEAKGKSICVKMPHATRFFPGEVNASEFILIDEVSGRLVTRVLIAPYDREDFVFFPLKTECPLIESSMVLNELSPAAKPSNLSAAVAGKAHDLDGQILDIANEIGVSDHAAAIVINLFK